MSLPRFTSPLTSPFTFRAVLMTSLSTLLFSGPIGCGTGGGGGGGGDFVGAATVTISTSPNRIDTGDQTLVSTRISEINDRGIALKFKFPAGLRYVPNSASLDANGDEQDIDPAFQATSSRENDNYLVFFLTQSQFQPSGRDYNGESGTLTIRLEGTSGVRDGLVEVDPDVDDPDINNSAEFDVNEPEFTAEDAASIEVMD
jgi:hypothetical protein